MFRWAIVGAGFAASKFALGVRASHDCMVKRVYSRDLDKARAFARTHQIPEASPSWDTALADGIDGIYIATPPTLHKEHALRCIAAGKAVLIEKPFAATAAEAREIVEAAAAARVFCMEGLWSLHLPIAAELRRVLAEGELGEIRSFSGSFGLANIPSPNDIQFNPLLGGGALRHRGIYPLAWALALLGPAQLAIALGRLNSQGVDEDCVIGLRHETGALSTLRASLRAPLENNFTIEASGGRLRVEAPIFRPFRYRIAAAAPTRRSSSAGGKLASYRDSSLVQALQQRLTGLLAISRRFRDRTGLSAYGGNGYHYQADETARCVAANLTESPAAPLSRTLLAADIVDAARARFIAAATTG